MNIGMGLWGSLLVQPTPMAALLLQLQLHNDLGKQLKMPQHPQQA